MDEQSSNKTIAKNTIFLYFRMMFTMVVSLFTSRVILQVLGLEDYGIYQTVGGVVGMLQFVNGALSTGSSRFLTYEMGTGNFDKLKRTFSSVLTAHLLLALLIVLVAETAGLWFVYNKLVIPAERMDAAVFAYHLSILAAVFQITQVPYNACIISHEKMGIYAYVSIAEVVLKLAIVYALYVGGWDKLMLYSSLFFIVNIGIVIFYRIYCTRNFKEAKYKPMWDKDIMKGVLSYSGWNLFANTSVALKSQGAVILINMFFNPSVVAARAVANQVNMAANQFIQNFRTAANPQIVKRYAAGDFEGSKSLLLSSTKFSYYLMLLLALPICLVAEPFLQLWLGQVPEYSVIFLQLAIITSLFQVFDTSFYTALYAKGQIRENALISPTLGFLAIIITYILFRLGCSPESLAWTMLVDYILLGLIIKPILIIKIVGYTWSDVMKVFRPCLYVSIAGSIIPVIMYSYRNSLFPNTIFQFVGLTAVSILSVAIAVWFIGMDKGMKEKLLLLIKSKLKH